MARAFSAESVDRALDLHVHERRIIRWHRSHKDGDHRLVVLANGEPIELRTTREAWLLVLGLGSAAQAERIRAQHRARAESLGPFPG